MPVILLSLLIAAEPEFSTAVEPTEIRDFAISADGRLAAASSSRGVSIRRIPFEGASLLLPDSKPLPGEENQLVFSADGTRLSAFCGRTSTIKVWRLDPAALVQVQTFDCLDDLVVFRGGGIVVFNDAPPNPPRRGGVRVRFYSEADVSRTPVQFKLPLDDNPYTLALSPTQILTVHLGRVSARNVRLWDRSMVRLRELNIDLRDELVPYFCDGSPLVAHVALNLPKGLEVTSVATGKTLFKRRTEAWIGGIVATREGRLVWTELTGGRSRTRDKVEFAEPNSATELWTMKGDGTEQPRRVCSWQGLVAQRLVVSADGGRALLGSTNADAPRTGEKWRWRRLFETSLAAEDLKIPIQGHHDSIRSVEFADDKGTVASLGNDDLLCFHESGTARLTRARQLQGDYLVRHPKAGVLLYSPRPHLNETSPIGVVDHPAAVGSEVAWRSSVERVCSLHVADDGESVQACFLSSDPDRGSDRAVLARYRLETTEAEGRKSYGFKLQKTLRANVYLNGASLDDDPRKSLFWAAFGENGIRVWNADLFNSSSKPTPKPLFERRCGRTCILAGDFAGCLAGHQRDDMAFHFSLHRRNDWECVRRLGGNASEITSVAASRDGSCVALGLQDGGVRIWETKSFREVLRVRPHDGAVTALRFSRNGRLLASGADDMKVLVHDVPEWRIH